MATMASLVSVLTDQFSESPRSRDPAGRTVTNAHGCDPDNGDRRAGMRAMVGRWSWSPECPLSRRVGTDELVE
jgi:hypothetical protein